MSSTERVPTGASWVRVLHLAHEAWLGLFNGELFVGVADGPQREIDPAEPTSLLPCLERPYSSVVAELREREHELSLPSGSLTARIPLTRIPLAAAQSKSNYWARLALAWLDEVPVSCDVVRALTAFEGASWASQDVQHKARRIRRAKGIAAC